jgi:sugar lactone lactonase YvrE
MRCSVNAKGKLSDMISFVETGEYGIAEGPDNNIYITSGEIFVYDRTGKFNSRIKVLERPTNLSFGGKDGKTLFITAGTSLYALKIK